MDQLDQLVAQAQADFEAAVEGAALEAAKARYLGKAGSLTELLKGLGKLDPEARKSAGAEINKAKAAIEALLSARRDALQQAALEAQLAAEALDVTLPGRGTGIGGLHPVVRTLERVEQLFRSIGFDVAEGPERDAAIEHMRAEIAAEKARVLEAGGLFVLGTERHESRRIDNQLRGRSARQGDPGSTRFYLSLQDDLMRIFARDWVTTMLKRLGMIEGQEIESPMVSRGIEKAQKREQDKYEGILKMNQGKEKTENPYRLHQELGDTMLRDCTIERPSATHPIALEVDDYDARALAMESDLDLARA